MSQTAWDNRPTERPAARHAAPRRPRGLIALGLALVVVIAGAVLLTRHLTGGSGAASGSPSPSVARSPASSAAPSPTVKPPRSGGQEIELSSGSGYWRVTQTRWEDAQVTVTVEVEADDGILGVEFYAIPAAIAPTAGATVAVTLAVTPSPAADAADGAEGEGEATAGEGADTGEGAGETAPAAEPSPSPAPVILKPQPGATDALADFVYISPGQSLTGTLTFKTTPRPLTLILSDGDVDIASVLIKAP
ncbi:MAG: hypothetical protein LBR33_07690 [Propionibacteriaceae bacterium]|jgi:hypothetical protein|nr:hypothetical protein [Propionibacteriaceae bacterium]